MVVEEENATVTAVHRDTTGAGPDPDPDREVVTVAEDAMTTMIAKAPDRDVIMPAGAAAAAVIGGGTEEGTNTAVVAAAAAEVPAGDRLSQGRRRCGFRSLVHFALPSCVVASGAFN